MVAHSCRTRGIVLHGRRFRGRVSPLPWSSACPRRMGLLVQKGRPASRSRPQSSPSQHPKSRCPSSLSPRKYCHITPLFGCVGYHAPSPTEGFAIGPGVWAVALLDLATLNLNVPVDVSGRSNLLITLVDVEGTILAEAASALVVGPAVVLAPDQQPAAALSAENKPVFFRPASNSQPTPQRAELSEARVEKLLAGGERHLAQGNIAAARAFFRRAADAGLADGATLLATTYDPVELQRLKVVGVVADRNEARKWYGRARELGALDDPSRFSGCKC